MLSRLLTSAFVLAGVNTAIADDIKMPTNSGELKWEAAPPTLRRERISRYSRRPLQRRAVSSPSKIAKRL